ncbi:MAG TPA: hypothetical protein VFO62_10370 [Candidatus Binatia bacterium]|nr:hypothetical protein [Candidatus Binatia bacterium]
MTENETCSALERELVDELRAMLDGSTLIVTRRHGDCGFRIEGSIGSIFAGSYIDSINHLVAFARDKAAKRRVVRCIALGLGWSDDDSNAAATNLPASSSEIDKNGRW